MIGNLEDATEAASRIIAPFASGTSRDVYLYDDVVYKVNTYPMANEMELDNIAWAMKKGIPEGIAIPAHTAFNVNGETVIAMEFIEGIYMGECTCAIAGVSCDCPPEETISEDIAEKLSSIGLTDRAYGNIIFSNGIYYAIDMEA